MVVPGWENLTNGSILTGVTTMYNASAIGNWWIILLFIPGLLASYVVTKSEGITGAVGIIGSIVLINYLPPFIHPVLYLIIVLSIAALLFAMTGKGE